MYIIRKEFAIDTITYWIEYSNDCGSTFTTTGIKDNISDEIQLFKVSPNPFESFPNLTFAIKEPGNVIMEIYSLTGECIRTINYNFIQRGSYSNTINTNGISPGVYMGVLKSNGNVIAKSKLIKH